MPEIDPDVVHRAYELRGVLLDDPRTELSSYLSGVHDALAWVLGEYDPPDGLPPDLYELAEGDSEP